MRIEIVRAWPDRVERWPLELPQGATLSDAIAAVAARGVSVEAEHVGVWGRREPLGRLLVEGDRVELYRPVEADPKAARLDRARQQGYRWQARTRRVARATSGTNETAP
ncbi:MAG: RnfH family protein [Casimicrobiaceae bacterium]